jgi:hypothetical protein
MIGKTKLELFAEAQILLKDFLILNPQIPTPTIKVVDTLPAHGQATKRTIKINIKKCAVATKTPGFKWSYPGYKADLTPIGVLCHELGHIIHFNIQRDYDKYVPKVRKKESKVSSYEPNIWETIAESTKLFISNPNLLKVGRPYRFEMLTEFIGVQPVHDTDWHEAFVNANPKFIAAAEKWIANKGKI